MATLRGSVERVATVYRAKLRAASDVRQKMKSFLFNNAYYNQIGLLYHDVLPHNSVVIKAVDRLPSAEYEARDFRISRALHLANCKAILPKNQWTKVEDDVPYLQPYIDLVLKEEQDKNCWDHFINAEIYNGHK